MGAKATKLTANITKTVNKIENSVASVTNFVKHPSNIVNTIQNIVTNVSSGLQNIEHSIQHKGFINFVEDAAKSYYHDRGILGIAMDVGFVASLFLTGGTSSVAGMVGFAGETLGFIEEAEQIISFGSKAAGFLEEAGILGTVKSVGTVVDTISDINDGWSLANNLGEALNDATKITEHYTNLMTGDPQYVNYKKETEKTMTKDDANPSNVYSKPTKTTMYNNGYTKPMRPPANTYLQRSGMITTNNFTPAKRNFGSYY